MRRKEYEFEVVDLVNLSVYPPHMDAVEHFFKKHNIPFNRKLVTIGIKLGRRIK